MISESNFNDCIFAKLLRQVFLSLFKEVHFLKMISVEQNKISLGISSSLVMIFSETLTSYSCASLCAGTFKNFFLYKLSTQAKFKQIELNEIMLFRCWQIFLRFEACQALLMISEERQMEWKRNLLSGNYFHLSSQLISGAWQDQND